MVKRILSLFSVFLIIAVSSLSVFAAGSNGDNLYDTEFVYSYWNIDNVYARTSDGRQMVFEFPTDFFYKTQLVTEDVVLRSVDGVHELHLRINGTEIDGKKYMAIELAASSNNSLYVEYEFTFLNSVIYQNNALIYNSVQPLSWDVPLFDIYDSNRTNDITLNAIQAFSSSYSVVMPNPRDDGSVGFDRSSGVISSISSSVYDYQTFYNFLVPQSVVDNVIGSFSSKGYTNYDSIPYFDYAKCYMLLDYSTAAYSYMTIYLPVGHCSSDLDYAVGNTMVSRWYDKYANFSAFPNAPSSDLDYGLLEITEFFGAVVSGIFNMEIFPGIFIGGIVFAIFGIFFVKAAIVFFSGG